MIFILGPCAIMPGDGANDIEYVATEIQKLADQFPYEQFWLRGGCWKPRTYSSTFQGAGEIGFERMVSAYKALPNSVNPIEGICVEVMDEKQYRYVKERCDELEIQVMFQIGSRNMQNFSLLRIMNESDNLILLKRGFGNTVEELSAAAGYLAKAKVYGCERGIRTFSDSSRFTLDLAAIPTMRKELNSIPMIVDVSHAAGATSLVEPLALAAIAVGADGIMIETENTPYGACCDKAQALPISDLMKLIKKSVNIVNSISNL